MLKVMSFNPSSRGKITAQTFDYGSDDNGNKAEKELQQFISENTDLEYYHNGKKASLKIEIEI